MTGSYQGHYSKGLITLVINYISGNAASGYDLHKGLRRNLNGRVDQKGGELVFELKEPGGNPFDGTFFLHLDTASRAMTGEWIPVDSTKAHAGPLNLSRKKDADTDDYGEEYEGKLGDLTFYKDGTCRLEYYPSNGDNSQLRTVRGNYERLGDTIHIDWQRNDHTPALNMKLTRTQDEPGTDSTAGSPHILKGYGLEFVERIAG
jgi:hypothetical protein